MKIHRRHFLGAASAGACAVFSPFSTTAQESDFAGSEGYRWPANQALPSFRSPHHLDAVDLRALPNGWPSNTSMISGCWESCRIGFRKAK